MDINSALRRLLEHAKATGSGDDALMKAVATLQAGAPTGTLSKGPSVNQDDAPVSSGSGGVDAGPVRPVKHTDGLNGAVTSVLQEFCGRKEEGLFVGPLNNSGASCFVNSTLQMLAVVPCVRQAAIDILRDAVESKNEGTKLNEREKRRVLIAGGLLAAASASDSFRNTATAAIFQYISVVMGEADNQAAAHGGQRSAADLVRIAVNLLGLHPAQVAAGLTCTQCSSSRETGVTPMPVIHLALPSSATSDPPLTLAELLTQNWSPTDHNMPEVRCSACGGDNKLHSEVKSLHNAPQVLVFEVNRAVPDGGEPNGRLVVFPLVLTAETLRLKPEHALAGVAYRLVSVGVHVPGGGSAAPHWVAISRRLHHPAVALGTKITAEHPEASRDVPPGTFVLTDDRKAPVLTQYASPAPDTSGCVANQRVAVAVYERCSAAEAAEAARREAEETGATILPASGALATV